MRQRIVINVDGPPSEVTKRVRATGGKSRHWLRVLAILAVFVLVVVVVAVAGSMVAKLPIHADLYVDVADRCRAAK